MTHKEVSHFVGELPPFTDFSTKKRGEKTDRYSFCLKFMEKISGGCVDEFLAEMMNHTERGQRLLVSIEKERNSFIVLSFCFYSGQIIQIICFHCFLCSYPNWTYISKSRVSAASLSIFLMKN
jgi:hypothetical protein